MNFDYTLYLVTDRQLMSCDSLTEAVEQAILGGCTMIQLREKELSSLEFYNHPNCNINLSAMPLACSLTTEYTLLQVLHSVFRAADGAAR